MEPRNKYPVFSESKTYVFQYEAIILNGLPEVGLARSGMKLNCKVEISGFAQKAYLLRITSPEIKEYNGIWPKDPFTRSSKLTQALAAQLSRPIKFEYSNGRVGNIFAPDGVSETIVNIYRGIVNMLQVTIKKTQNVYDLQESGVTGVCHTRYIIQEDKRTDRIIVVKSRDLNNCQEKVEKNIGMAYVEKCSSCQKSVKNLRRAATFTYKMKPRDGGALITEVTVRQVYQFSPFYELYGAAVMEARQVLSFVETKSNRVNSPQTELQNRGGLQYQFASEVFQMPIQLVKTRSPETQVAETLQHLVQNNQQQVHADAPAKFLQLAQILRAANYENIQAIWKQFADRPQYRRWLLNAIPAVGTIDALKVIKQKIHNEELSPREAAQAVTLAVQLTRADHQTLQVAQDLVKVAEHQKSPTVYKAAILAYGSMVNKYCGAHSSCPEEALSPLHDLAAEAANNAHEEDMALALKALGNAGQPASIKRIQKFLPGFSSSAYQLPVRIQTDAVMALRNIAKDDPRRVQEILLQILMDRQVRTEVRMMASMVLFETKPGLALVTTVANIASKESKVNLQLASFVYSQIKALSRNRVTALHQVAAACSVAVKMLNPMLDRMSYRYSKALHMGSFQHALMAGATADVVIMNSANTMFPVFLLAKTRGYFTGAEADILEIAVRAEGLEQTLRKQNIPFAEYPMRKKIHQIVKTLLGFKALPADTPLISAYIKLFGQEMAFLNIDKEVIQTAIKAVNEPAARHSMVKTAINKLLNGVAGQFAQAVLAAEVRQIVPTCVGLPMELSIYSAAVANAAVNTDVKVSPSPSSDFSLAQLLESNIQVHADVAPSVSKHTVATMGINTHLIQAGIEFHAKEVSSELLSKRYAYSAEDKDHRSAARSTNAYQACAKAKTFGFQVCLEYKSQNAAFLRNSPLYKLIGENEAKLVIKPAHTDAAIEKLMLEVQAGSKAASKIITMVTVEENEGEELEDSVVQMKLKKILGIDEEHATNPEIYDLRFTPAHRHSNPKRRASGHRSSSQSSSSSSSSSSSASSARRPQRPAFMGDNKPPVLAVTAQAVRNDHKKQGYQVIVYADYHSSKPQIQAYAVEIAGSSRWRACANAVIVNSHEAQAYLKWGQNCQDYKIAAKAQTGHFGSQPGLRLKVEWPRIPSKLKSAGKWAAQFVPGAALIAGFSEKLQKNPSKQATIILSLNSPRTIDAVMQIPRLTLYYRSIQLPVAIPAGHPTQVSAIQSPSWNIFTEAPDYLLDKLRGRCMVSKDTITIFNDVSFNYSMPRSCYHVLVQDCTPELNFLVMMKKVEGSSEQKIINVKLGSYDIDMYPSADSLKIKINGIEVNSLPYESHSEPHLRIEKETGGLILLAPDFGIEKLSYDGITCQVRPALWMKGKTCGVCGRHDDELEQEYQMPDGFVAKNEESFVQSWITEESCSVHL
ncbi:hypothetical protein NDU88_003160 [Pleurodeles waltl]|uniref:Phosvitin n=1 Tax=Pleurodeles waltl TaxID=8319 RepID=A0AAV7T4F8_PLEWA|nr:hypothetical protein NDU88_003160 [Pleurodeles waltl]